MSVNAGNGNVLHSKKTLCIPGGWRYYCGERFGSVEWFQWIELIFISEQTEMRCNTTRNIFSNILNTQYTLDTVLEQLSFRKTNIIADPDITYLRLYGSLKFPSLDVLCAFKNWKKCSRCGYRTWYLSLKRYTAFPNRYFVKMLPQARRKEIWKLDCNSSLTTMDKYTLKSTLKLWFCRNCRIINSRKIFPSKDLWKIYD